MYSRRLGCCKVENFNGPVKKHPEQENKWVGDGVIWLRMPQTSGNSMIECLFLRNSSVTDSKLQR